MKTVNLTVATEKIDEYEIVDYFLANYTTDELIGFFNTFAKDYSNKDTKKRILIQNCILNIITKIAKNDNIDIIEYAKQLKK